MENETEKEFFITSTITIMAKSREEACERIEAEKRDENNQSFMAYELLNNAEIDEA